jgi:hypothetical protein
VSFSRPPGDFGYEESQRVGEGHDMTDRDRRPKTVGSGSVSIPDYRNHPMLGEPIADDPLRSGPLFEASWTHALHCVR